MTAKRVATCSGGAIVRLDVIPFGAPVVIVVTVGAGLFRVESGNFCHEAYLQAVPINNRICTGFVLRVESLGLSHLVAIP